MMELSSGSHSEESEVGQTLLHTPQPVTALKRKLQQMPSEPPYDNVSWKKKLSVPGMDWSTCRGRFKKVSVHANMTLLIGGPHGLFVNCSESQKIITPANGIMFQHHILTEHKQDSSINAMNF